MHRWFAFAGAMGVAMACTIGAAPDYLNGVQFAWSASFPLWLVLRSVGTRWLAGRRAILLAPVLALALASSWSWRRGEAARSIPVQSVDEAERELRERFAVLSEPGDLVLEPSAVLSPETLSPVPWLAGRPVSLSSRHVAAYLAPSTTMRRIGEIYSVYGRDERGTALAALAATRGPFVEAPAALPLRFDPVEGLEIVVRGSAGVIYRVRSLSP